MADLLIPRAGSKSARGQVHPNGPPFRCLDSERSRAFRDQSTPMREWIYGVGYPRGNEQIYVARI